MCFDVYITSISYEDHYVLVKYEATDVPDYVLAVVFPPNKARYSHDVIHSYLMWKVDPAQMSHIFEKILKVTLPKAIAKSYQSYTTIIWKALGDYKAAKTKGNKPTWQGRAFALQMGSQLGTAQSCLATLKATRGGQCRKCLNPNPSSSGLMK